jgi:hypothetical protein
MQSQSFRLIAIAEQTGFKAIEPGDFFRTGKRRMIRNVVGDANELVKRQNGRPVPPLDQS